MPSFDFPTLLTWGLPLALLPVVIHLINLLKHRTIDWAAVEFLLASQKKYRTRVILKQLLLLAMRVAAVAGIVALFAQPRLTTALGQLLGGSQATHLVLLDDSFSMADAAGGKRCFARGLAVLERICQELSASTGTQELAIGRFSRLAPTGDRPPEYDLDRQPVGPESLARVRSLVESLDASHVDVGPGEPLARAVELFGGGGGATGVLWLVSDFRRRDWKAAEETAASMRALADAGVQLRLVDCAETGTADADEINLGLETLEPAGGVPASGVLLPFELTVRNWSSKPARGVEVELEEDGAPRPGLRLEEIPAGGTVSRRIESRFPASGGHTLVARLPPDRLADDDRRSTAVEVSDGRDVLVIDGDLAKGTPARQDGDALYLTAALAPGSGAPTGLRPRVEPPRGLATLDLETFDCVYLLDVERLDDAEIRPLEAYVKGGGGVVFFMGPKSDADFLTQKLHRGGDGVFPVPVAGPVDLTAKPADGPPDVVVDDHPVVAVLSGQRNPLLDGVRVERVMAVDREFEAGTDGGLRRLLGLRTGQPLMLERTFGDGRSVAVMTTAAPVWNNWSRGNPSWVVVMLELESHLARARARTRDLEVGDRVEVVLESGTDEIEVDFVLPSGEPPVHATASPQPDGRLVAALDDTRVPGVYAARWRRTDGTERERLAAVNVNPDEGDLERIGRDRLSRALAGVPHRIDAADDLEPDSTALAGASLVTPLIYALLALLVLEQLLAYSASYHIPARRAAAKGPAQGRT